LFFGPHTNLFNNFKETSFARLGSQLVLTAVHLNLMPQSGLIYVISLRLSTLLLKPYPIFSFPGFLFGIIMELGMLQFTPLRAGMMISTQTLQLGTMFSVTATMSMTVSRNV
jgi:hypothetical protein